MPEHVLVEVRGVDLARSLVELLDGYTTTLASEGGDMWILHLSDDRTDVGVAALIDVVKEACAQLRQPRAGGVTLLAGGVRMSLASPE